MKLLTSYQNRLTLQVEPDIPTAYMMTRRLLCQIEELQCGVRCWRDCIGEADIWVVRTCRNGLPCGV